jgi:hypothetical protein
MSVDQRSLRAPTCFRAHHRRVDLRHVGPTDTGLHQTPTGPRKTRAATCQRSRVRNLHSHPRLFLETSEVTARNFVYVPMRRNSKVVSGFRISPFISRSG